MPASRGPLTRLAMRPSASVLPAPASVATPSSTSSRRTSTAAAGLPTSVSSTWVEMVGRTSLTAPPASVRRVYAAPHGPCDHRRRPALYRPLGCRCTPHLRGDAPPAAAAQPADPLPLERRRL